MTTLTKPNTMGNPFKNTGINPRCNEKSAKLQQAEEAAIKWASELTTANQILLAEKNLQLAAHTKALKAESDLNTLHAENPNNILKNQQKSLHIALNSLTKTKNKTVIGAIEMVAISASLCALTMTTVGLLASDLFLTLISFKIPAILLIGSAVGSSGLLGWNADRKAALITRMAQDEVKASQTAVNQDIIRCQDYEIKLKQKIAETKLAQEDLKNANVRVNEATEAVRHAEQNLNNAKKKIAGNDNIKLSGYKPFQFQQSTEKSKSMEERQVSTLSPM